MKKLLKQYFCNHVWRAERFSSKCDNFYKNEYICTKCGKSVIWTRNEFLEYGDDTVLLAILAIAFWITIICVGYQFINWIN